MECPNCKGKILLKDEATYIYSYEIGEEKDGITPYLFYNREQKDFHQYLQCETCKRIYDFNSKEDPKIDFTILQKAVRSDTKTTSPYIK